MKIGLRLPQRGRQPGPPESDDGPGDGQTLAGLLRQVRLSALVADDAAAGSALLKTGVLPLLHRRRTDEAAPKELTPRVVVPFPDRRRGRSAAGSSSGTASRTPEVAVYLDTWHGSPLQQLRAALHDAVGVGHTSLVFARGADSIALAIAGSQVFGAESQPVAPAAERAVDDAGGGSLSASVAALNTQYGARFLVVLDGFGHCLRAAPADPGARRFIDAMVEALRQPLPIHFLAALQPADQPLLDRLRARVAGLQDHTLRLASLPAPAQLAQPASAPTAAARVQSPLRQVPPASQSAASGPKRPTDSDWYDALSTSVARAAVLQVARGEPGLDASPAPAPTRAAFAAASIEQTRPAPTPAPAVAPIADVAPSVAAVAAVAAVPSPTSAPIPAPAPHAAAADASTVAPAPVHAVAAAPLDSGTAGPAAASRVVASGSRLRPTLWWAAMPAAAAVAAVLVWPRADRPAAVVPAAPQVALGSAPRAPAAQEAAPRPQVPAAAPSPDAAPPADDIDADRLLLGELAHALGAPAATPAAPVAWPAGFTTIPGHPGLALARYDALRAARRAAPNAPIAVVAPLYTEEISFIARAGSALQYIHDIRGARINVGPSGAAALTAAASYERLFNAPIPPARASALGGDAALQALLAGGDVDVMVRSGPQPARWLAALPADTARGLKLLKADPSDPQDQRALRSYLPATLRAVAGGGATSQETPTLGVLTFLVAAAVPGDHAVSAARSLCSQLPNLRRDGHPKWREVQPALQLQTGWPAAPGAVQALQSCAALAGVR